MKTIVQDLILITLVVAFMTGGCGPEPQGKQAQAVANQSSQPVEYYTCPMHPSVRSDKPGACPVCHMSLVKVAETQGETDSSQADGSVALSNAEQIRANVTTAIVETKALVKEISAVGKIDLAEPNTQRISTRFGGRIERLFVSFVGQKIRAGEPVAQIYSPDAVAAQRELLVAMDSPDTSSGGSDLLNQTRMKLTLWGFTDQQLDRIARDRDPSITVTIYSPISGTVLRKNVDVEQYVSAGESLFEVSDLRSVWLQLDVYESDLASVHIGQAVIASLDAVSSRTVKGTVSLISPILDPVTRTARVRVILDNSSGNLRPEMYAHAIILVPLGKSLVVSRTSVVSNGRSDIVWIEREPGHFEARRVVLGEQSGEFYQILSGLHENELVAVSGAYLIDSESKLRQSTAGDSNK